MQFLHGLCKVITYWGNNRPICFISSILRKKNPILWRETVTTISSLDSNWILEVQPIQFCLLHPPCVRTRSSGQSATRRKTITVWIIITYNLRIYHDTLIIYNIFLFCSLAHEGEKSACVQSLSLQYALHFSCLSRCQYECDGCQEVVKCVSCLCCCCIGLV